MLNTAHAVGNLAEIAQAEFFLVFHAERAMVGRDDRQLVHAQTLPQVGVVMMVIMLRANRRRAHELGTLEAGTREVVFERHIEVLRAGFSEHVEAFMLRGCNFIQRIRSRHVHDVQRHVSRHFRQHDGTMRRLALKQARA